MYPMKRAGKRVKGLVEREAKTQQLESAGKRVTCEKRGKHAQGGKRA